MLCRGHEITLSYFLCPIVSLYNALAPPGLCRDSLPDAFSPSSQRSDATFDSRETEPQRSKGTYADFAKYLREFLL